MSSKVGKAKNNDGKELTGYKYHIDTSCKTSLALLNQNLGAARWMYNRYVADYKAALDSKQPPTVKTPAEYKCSGDAPWLNDMDSLNLANVQKNFLEALRRFHDGVSGFPKFKSKRDRNDSYTTNMVNGNIKLLRKEGGVYLKLPKIHDPVRLICHRPIPEDGKIKSVTVSHEPDGKYYASILIAQDEPDISHQIDPNNAIGLDMSLPKLYVDSNGEEADYEKPFRKNEKRLAREQRKLSHMEFDSNNYNKQRQKVARLHAKIKHQRKDRLHKLSCQLTNAYDIIGIEDLDMDAMKKALRFGKSVSDNGWGMFVGMLSYKSKRKGKALIKVDKWFPSSKTCSVCGYIHRELKLSDRVYVCPACGNVMDRDHQAAINILNEAIAVYVSSQAIPA